jgi:hypothetical protein
MASFGFSTWVILYKEGDVLTTGIGARILLEFFDGNALQLGENIEILLDETVFDGLKSFPDARVDQLDDLFALGDAAIDNQTPEADDSDSDKIKAVGKGEENPLADNSTEFGQAINRRGEFTFKANEASE